MITHHQMQYRAGVSGLRHLGYDDRDPEWFCTCREWRFDAKEMPRRRSGNNRREAELSYTRHLSEVPGAYGAGPGYN